MVDRFAAAELAAIRYFGRLVRFVGPKIGRTATVADAVWSPRGEWELRLRSDDCRDVILIARPDASASTPSLARNRYFAFSYRGGDDSPESRLAFAFAKALARAPLEPPPNVLEPPPLSNRTAKRHGVEMKTICDRACIFCNKNFRRVADPTVPPWTAERMTPERIARRERIVAEEWEVLQKRLPELWQQGTKSLNWSGDDVCSNPHFVEAIELAYEIGFREMNVQSPGTALADLEFQRFLYDHGVRGFSLTWHAPSAALFERVGGHPDGLELIEAVVEGAAEIGIECYVRVPCISLNAHAVPELVAQLARRRFRGLEVFYWHPEELRIEAYDALPLSLEGAADVWRATAARLDVPTVEISGVPACGVPSDLVDKFHWDVSAHHLGSNRLGHHSKCDTCVASDRCVGLPMGFWDRYEPTPILDADDARLGLFDRRR